jgi:hypothetical protein
MNVDALVAKGHLPWSPNPDSGDLDVWYEYEYPRIGAFTTNGATVLFAFVGGSETRMSVWAYACLEPGEADEFASVSFASLPDLRQFIHETFADRGLVLALADDLLISNWTVSEDGGELYEAATKYLEQVLALSRDKQNAGTRFRAKLAQVDVATHELIEA